MGMEGLRVRDVQLKQQAYMGGRLKAEALEIDGRERDVEELCWEMLDFPNVKIRL